MQAAVIISTLLATAMAGSCSEMKEHTGVPYAIPEAPSATLEDTGGALILTGSLSNTEQERSASSEHLAGASSTRLNVQSVSAASPLALLCPQDVVM